MKRALIFMLVLLVSASLFAGGGGGQVQQGAAGERVVTQVTPRPLTVRPLLPPDMYLDMGNPVWHPQPATSYSTNPRYPHQPPISNPNGFPIVQTPITITALHSMNPTVLDPATNDVATFMRELTNIHVDWIALPSAAATERMNLMFASGEDLPDMIWGVGIPMPMQNTIGPAGLIIPLQGFIEEHMPNYARRMQQFPNIMPTMGAADGNIYALSGFGINEANKVAMRMWINTEFLSTLGMQTPTTTEEFYQYLVAVRDRNPNRSGLFDEIPLIGNGRDSWHSHIDGYLMNAFIINETSDSTDPLNRRRMFLTEAGQVDVSYNKPEWRQGLEYMHRLYAEGLMAPETFTINRAGVMALVEYPSHPILGAFPEGGIHNVTNTAGTRRTIYSAIAPLRGPNGVQWAYYDEFLGIGGGSTFITRDSLVPEAIVKMLDYAATPDWAMRNRYGVLGRDWEIPRPGTRAVDGSQAIFNEILLWGTPQNAYMPGLGPSFSEVASYNREMGPDPFELEYVLWNARQLYYPYRFTRSVPRTISFTIEESREYNELNMNLVQYIEVSMAQFITGATALNDANWNAYVNQINNLGLSRLLSITQAGFDRQWAATLGYRR